MDKEILRLKQNLTKAETTSVTQDIQKYKQLMMNPDKLSPEDLTKQVADEFDPEWLPHLVGISDVINFLQAEDEQSKFLFNSVKNVTKQLQQSRAGEDGQTKLKFSNGFKNLVSKVIRQTLTVLAFKLETYLQGSTNHQIKLDDIKKVVSLWISFDDVNELKTQLNAFNDSVAARLVEIQSAKQGKKLSSSTTSSA